MYQKSILQCLEVACFYLYQNILLIIALYNFIVSSLISLSHPFDHALFPITGK